MYLVYQLDKIKKYPFFSLSDNSEFLSEILFINPYKCVNIAIVNADK